MVFFPGETISNRPTHLENTRAHKNKQYPSTTRFVPTILEEEKLLQQF